jgi:putative transposase
MSSEAVTIKAFRFQMRTRPGIESKLRRFAGMGRWVWCKALAEQRARYARGEKYAGHAEMCKWLTGWRNELETSWLSEGPIHPQQQVLKRLDDAYRQFFANVKAGKTGRAAGFPKFKRYGEDPGIRFPDPKQFSIDADNGRIKLPKLGWIRLRRSQPVVGGLRNVSLTCESGKWFASIQVKISMVATARDIAPSLGIDLGLTAFAATSEGEIVAPLRALAKQQRRLKFAQRAVSRKKKGSCNRRKAIAKLGAAHRKIALQRADWLHKLTTSLADRHAVIAIEDLKVKNMSSSAKGSAEAPGKKVRQKAGLNRSILDASWSEFRRQLEYKTTWRGGLVIAVNPAYTSRTCRLCLHESAENRKTQEVFCCLACGHTENADIHAAKNILAAGHAAWLVENSKESSPAVACGGVVRRPRGASRAAAAPAKQEPAEVRSLV